MKSKPRGPRSLLSEQATISNMPAPLRGVCRRLRRVSARKGGIVTGDRAGRRLRSRKKVVGATGSPYLGGPCDLRHLRRFGPVTHGAAIMGHAAATITGV